MVKTQATGGTILASDWNAEFLNILNNLTPAGVDDESTNEAAMQATADPYPGSVASLPTSLQGEIQRLRYLIAQITGETYWYIDPDTTIAALKTLTTALNVMTTQGDMVYGGADGVPTRFGIGSDSQVLSVKSDLSGPEWKTIAYATQAYKTKVDTTSGATQDIGSIPAGTKKITIMLNGVSTNGTSPLMLQIGDAGGIETTGYVASTAGGVHGNTIAGATQTSGVQLTGAGYASYTVIGHVILTNITGNIWIISGQVAAGSAAAAWSFGGSKTLSDTITQVRLTTVGGSDTFDAGSFNILYEY